MIIFKKRFGGFNLLSRIYGAPWPRAMILSLPGTSLGLLVALFAHDFVIQNFLHPAAYLVFGTLVTFGLVFRTNMSYQRYWEGCSSVRTMTCKWADAAIQVLSFDEAAERDKIGGGLRFRSEFVHSMSLMHALALLRLRGDESLANIAAGSFTEVPKPPPVDPAEVSQWSKVRDSKSLFVLSTGEDHFKDYWHCTPLTVIGGLNPSQEGVLEESSDRVFLVMCWILRGMLNRRLSGGLKAEAPIISRIYQVLSDGMMGFEHAHKITATPFPFPFAQSVAILLHINALVAPLALARWAGQAWLVAVMSFLAVFATFLLNEVAREIEDPFRFDPNDLPLPYYQHCFNEHLVTAFVKSLLPDDAIVFFNQIAVEEDMQKLVDRHRPTLRRSTAIDITASARDLPGVDEGSTYDSEGSEPEQSATSETLSATSSAV